MKIVSKNLLSVDKGLICHQTNPYAFGGGLAGQIALKYPEVKAAHKHFTSNNLVHLGDVLYCNTSTHLSTSSIPEYLKLWTADHLIVCNLFGQDRYGREKGVCYTQYPFLSKAMHKIYHTSKMLEVTPYFPYGIGCGLAGGSWEIVEQIIKDSCPNAVVCKKNN